MFGELLSICFIFLFFKLAFRLEKKSASTKQIIYIFRIIIATIAVGVFCMFLISKNIMYVSNIMPILLFGLSIEFILFAIFTNKL